MTVRLLDVRVWNHAEQPGHSVYVRGPFPRRIWRCARHDCDWSHHETTGVTVGDQEATPPEHKIVDGPLPSDPAHPLVDNGGSLGEHQTAPTLL